MHNRFFKFLSDVKLLNITLPILMVYLVIGTVAQKYIGLYQATHDIFYSPIFWIGFIPVPGMPIFMGILVLNLTCYVFLRNPWERKKVGTLVSHIGVILLLVGGLYTALFSKTGYIDLAISEIGTHVSDYHNRDFIVRDMKTNKITSDFSALPVSIRTVESCQNCEIIKRTEKNETFQGMAQNMQLVDKELELQNEENMAGITFTVQGSENDGTYLVLEGVPQYPEITVNDQIYRFELNKAKRALPFDIQLIDFRRINHPGINMAFSYESDVLITDHDVQWQSTIGMNEPLRYKGYTFFQSSFIETPIGDRSVLSVVQNAGRAFPYIPGFAICLGILMHLILNVSTLTKKGKK